MKKYLFTIILSNYNQEKYIYTALDSILSQTYKNIELIISDDASRIFNKEEIENYINKNGKNILDLKFIINKKNIGTVKTFNKCLKKATGKFVLLFAADDKLANKNIIAKFVASFENNHGINIISSICDLCDENLKSINNFFPNKEKRNFFNNVNVYEQNWILRTGPIFAPGATAYRLNLFKELNFLDERYNLIEDWSWILKCSRYTQRILIEDFTGLKHRGGGISETTKLTKNIIEKILNDTYNIYKHEVFVDFKKIPFEYRLDILKRYKLFINMYGKFNFKFFIIYWLNIFINPKIFYHKLKFNKRFIINVLSLISSILISIIIYIVLRNKLIISICVPLLYKIILNISKAVFNK